MTFCLLALIFLLSVQIGKSITGEVPSMARHAPRVSSPSADTGPPKTLTFERPMPLRGRVKLLMTLSAENLLSGFGRGRIYSTRYRLVNQKNTYILWLFVNTSR